LIQEEEIVEVLQLLKAQQEPLAQLNFKAQQAQIDRLEQKLDILLQKTSS